MRRLLQLLERSLEQMVLILYQGLSFVVYISGCTQRDPLRLKQLKDLHIQLGYKYLELPYHPRLLHHHLFVLLPPFMQLPLEIIV